MAPHLRDNRTVFAGVGVILLAVLVTVSALALVLNTRCTNAFWDAANVYPGATVIEQESNFLGLQRAVYHTDDSPAKVDSWLTSEQAARMRAGVTSGNFNSVAQFSPYWTVKPDTEHGGSLITFAATCP